MKAMNDRTMLTKRNSVGSWNPGFMGVIEFSTRSTSDIKELHGVPFHKWDFRRGIFTIETPNEVVGTPDFPWFS